MSLRATVVTFPVLLILLGAVVVAAPPGGHSAMLPAVASQAVAGSGAMTSLSSAAVPPAPTAVAGAPEWKQLHLVNSSGGSFALSPDAPAGTLILPAAMKKGGSTVNFDLAAPLAKDFVALNFTAALYLASANQNPSWLIINLTVADWNGAAGVAVATVQHQVFAGGYQKFLFYFPAVNYTFPQGHTIRLGVADVKGSGQDADLATNSTLADSQLDVLTTTYVTVDRINLTDAKGQPGPLSPKDSLVIGATISDPFGPTEISDARLNVTAPPGGANLTAVSMGAPVSSGGATALYQYTISPLLANGTYSVAVVAIERNGVSETGSNATTVQAPGFTFTKVAGVPQAKSGNLFTYTLFYNNTGSDQASHAWINDTLPTSQVSFQSSTPAPSSVSGNVYGWSFTNLAIGSHRVDMTVRIQGGLNGVAYIHNVATLAFVDLKGYPWPGESAFADVILNGPVLSLTVASNPATWIHDNETLIDSISIRNTGDAAQTLWVNATLPTGLAYVSNTAGTLGGTTAITGGTVQIRLTNMPAGSTFPVTWSFTFTLVAGPSLLRAAGLTTPFTLNDTSATGLLMPEQHAAITVTVAAPWITGGTLRFASLTVVPSVPLPVYVNFTNAGNEIAPRAWLNITLDPTLTILGAPVPWTSTSNLATLNFTNVSLGAVGLLLSVRAASTDTDREVLSISATIDYRDGYGNPEGRATVATGFASIALPRFVLGVTPTTVSLEAGVPITYTVSSTNAGSGVASIASLNVTLPSGFLFVNDTLAANLTSVGPDYSWSWGNLGPGTRIATIVLRASPSAPDGSSANVTFRLGGRDAGGKSEPSSNVTVYGNFVAPGIVAGFSADRSSVLPGDTFGYTLTVRNEGSTAAHLVWVNDSVDPRLQVVTYNARVSTTGNQSLNWTFADLQPGQSQTIELFVKVLDGIPANTLIPAVFTVTYTNSLGMPIGYVRSLSITIEVQADLRTLIGLMAGGGAIGGCLVYLVYRRYGVQIEDVFLISKDGLLISHLSRSLVYQRDEDVLSGMLTAIQDFVRDAFRYSEQRDLHQLEFGDYRILIEQGRQVYLAVIYSGHGSGLIRRKVRAALNAVESDYGGVLAKWDGDMDSVAGVRDLLQAGLPPSRKPSPSSPPRTS